MAITKNNGRQTLLSAYVDINLADIATGVAAEAIDLPYGAVVVSGSVDVLTAFNSTTSDVIDVGDSGSANRYLNDGSTHAPGRLALVPTGFPSVGDPITVTWVSGGGTPTTGKARLSVQYYVIDRATSSLG